MRVKILKSQLKELIRQSIREIDFKDKEAFHKYDKKHKMRASTKVKIGGKETTVGQAIDVGGPSHADVPKKKSAKDMDWYGGGDFTKSADYDMWSDDDVEKTAMGAADDANKKMDRDEKNKDVEDVIKKKGLEGMDLPFWSVEIKGQELPYNIRAKSAKEAKHLTHQMAQNKDVELGNVKVDDERWEKVNKFGIKKESVRESKGKRTTVKEVRMWMKTLEENRYKKTYNSDCRRVSWMVNHMGENVENMPVSMRKKWSKAQYGRERYLAKEFLKSKKQQMAESKLRKTIRESIKNLMEGPAKYGHRWEIPMKDKKKVEAIVKKLKVPSNSYAIYGSGRTFEMEISAGKHANKVLELLMKMNIKVRG
jgi:hypothetical protein